MKQLQLIRIITEHEAQTSPEEMRLALDEFMQYCRNQITGPEELQNMLYMKEIFACSMRECDAGRSENSLLYTCICKASAAVAARIRIEEYRMQYPQAELFTQKQGPMESELFWNPEYGKRALMEILTSLYAMEAFLNKSGNPSSFASIIAHFEVLLHVELPRPYQIRTQVLERKLKRTDFIDKMKDALIKLSEEKGV